jgi:hypothetical protein
MSPDVGPVSDKVVEALDIATRACRGANVIDAETDWVVITPEQLARVVELSRTDLHIALTHEVGLCNHYRELAAGELLALRQLLDIWDSCRIKHIVLSEAFDALRERLPRIERSSHATPPI